MKLTIFDGSTARYAASRSAAVSAIGAVALSLLTLAGTASFSSVATAQDNRTTTVKGRARPELDALGVRQGGFLLFPAVVVGMDYNDNIFAVQDNANEDHIFGAEPELRVSSDWNRHALNFFGQGQVVRLVSNEQENFEEYNLSADGQVDIRRDTNVTFGAGYQLDSEERGSVDDANGTEPTEVVVKTLDAGLYNRWNRVAVNVDGSFAQRDFDDVPTSTGSVNNDDRDRNEYLLELRAGYEIVPQYEAFIKLIGTSVDYDDATDDAGVNRDSDGYEIRLGARIDISGKLFGDVFISYIERDFDADTLQDIEEVSGGVNLTWNATQLTTVVGSITRGIDETTLGSAGGNVQTAVNASVDHELLRNLILSGNLGVSRDEFDGTDREDDYIRGGISAQYMLNRYLYFNLGYDYTDRDSSTAGADYDRNRISARVKVQL